MFSSRGEYVCASAHAPGWHLTPAARLDRVDRGISRQAIVCGHVSWLLRSLPVCSKTTRCLYPVPGGCAQRLVCPGLRGFCAMAGFRLPRPYSSSSHRRWPPSSTLRCRRTSAHPRHRRPARCGPPGLLAYATDRCHHRPRAPSAVAAWLDGSHTRGAAAGLSRDRGWGHTLLAALAGALAAGDAYVADAQAPGTPRDWPQWGWRQEQSESDSPSGLQRTSRRGVPRGGVWAGSTAPACILILRRRIASPITFPRRKNVP